MRLILDVNCFSGARRSATEQSQLAGIANAAEDFRKMDRAHYREGLRILRRAVRQLQRLGKKVAPGRERHGS